MSVISQILRPTRKALAGVSSPAAAFTVGAARHKHTLPNLPYGYGELEPKISGRIMELHHKMHHQTYINNLNEAEAKYDHAIKCNDVQQQIALQPLLKFHGGGHINHTLFWENLAPSKNGGGEPPSGKLAEAISQTWGSFDKFKQVFNTHLASIQGSGWSWLVRNGETQGIEIISLPNQDPVVGKYTPLMGIDAWEHAYYLDYENRKAAYFAAIWDVINWKVVAQRYGA